MSQRDYEKVRRIAEKYRKNLSHKWCLRCLKCGEGIIITDIHKEEDEKGKIIQVGAGLCPRCMKIMKVKFTNESEVIYKMIKYSDTKSAESALRNTNSV